MDEIEQHLSVLTGLGAVNVIFETRIRFQLPSEARKLGEDGFTLWDEFADGHTSEVQVSSGRIFPTPDVGTAVFVLRTSGAQKDINSVRVSHVLFGRAFLRTFSEFNGPAEVIG